jgi:hypothetical protein
VRPPRLAVRFGVDHLDPWWTGSFLGNPAFIGATLSDVRGIIMRVLMVGLSYQVVMGQISVLECLSARRAWAPVGRSCLVWHQMASLSEDLGSLATCLVLGIPSGVVFGGPGACHAGV